MVFARSKTRLNNIPTFKFGNIDLEQVEDYIYLGICFNWNWSFVKAKKLLHDKASKAMYSLILGTGSQNYKCQKYVISWLHNAGIAITSIIKQTRRFYV